MALLGRAQPSRSSWLCAAALLALGMGMAMAGACFSPQQPACAFTCATPPHACPEGYSCGADNICHKDTGDGICPLDGVDAAGGADASADGGPPPDAQN